MVMETFRLPAGDLIVVSEPLLHGGARERWESAWLRGLDPGPHPQRRATASV